MIYNYQHYLVTLGTLLRYAYEIGKESKIYYITNYLHIYVLFYCTVNRISQ